MPDRSRKRPRDPNELAKRLVDEATGEAEKFDPYEGKDPATGTGEGFSLAREVLSQPAYAFLAISDPSP